MRARNLKPGLFKNEQLGSVDPLHTILFAGLWCLADREGRLLDRPLRICAELFPYRRGVTERRVDTMLGWLAAHKFIQRYEVSGGRFIQITGFNEHQRPHSKEGPSKIPALETNQHRPGSTPSTDLNPASTDLGNGEHALTPDSLNSDSGLRTPDSGYLIPDSGDPAVGTAVGEDACARARSRRDEAAPGSATRRISGRVKNGNGGTDPEETRRKVLKALEGGLDAATIALSLHVPLEQVRSWQREAQP